MIFREYFPTDFNIFKDATSITLFILFIVFFLLGFFIIHRQVALVKKGEFEIVDWVRCGIYGFIFSMAIMIVMGMAFIFAVNTPDFWEQKPWESEPPVPPEISPLWLVLPLLICLFYIAFYPLVDFLYIALSEETDEGLTPFHKFLGDHWINRSENKIIRIISAVVLWSLFFFPPLFFWYLDFPYIMVLVTWCLVYPMMILTFYGAKGYIAGLSNVYYHLPDLKRSLFLGFEDGKRSMEEFAKDPGPRILLGLMLFVFVWAWISMIQTLAFYFSGTMAISTYSYAGMVFVTLLFGIIGYFTRFWGRKIKYRGIDIFFAAYLMAAVGVNVLVNFLLVNPEKLEQTFNYGIIGLHELIPNFRLFAFPAVIEECVLIIITSYYFLAKKNEFTGNIKYSMATESGQSFDPMPLFNFIKSDNYDVRTHAEETLVLMYERIPLKKNIDLNHIKYKYPLLDAICDYNLNSRRIGYNILVQLERDVPDVVLPWILECLNSPNYDKSIPVARSLLESDISLVEEIPEASIYNMINDSEWRLKRVGIKILSRLVNKKEGLLANLDINQLVNDPDSKVQVEMLNLLAESSVELPIEIIMDKLNDSNKIIRAAAIRNIKNLKAENISSTIILKIIPLMRGPAIQRAAIFETFAKVGNFRKYFIPVLPFLEGLTDLNKDVRDAAILALKKYFDEEPESMDIDVIINKIDPNNNEVLNSVLSLLGSLWEKNPKKILIVLLIFIKFENDQLKNNISEILVEKYKYNPNLVLQKLIEIPDVSKFVTKGIIARTLIKIAEKDPEKVIPKLMQFLDSEKEEIVLNALVSLDGLTANYMKYFTLKPFLLFLQKDVNNQIKKEATKIISAIAKHDPSLLKPVMSVFLQSINQQETSVKIVLLKSLLEMAKESSDVIPIRPIINFLSDEDSFIRESGARILGYIGFKAPDEAVDAIINKGLNDEEWIVREAAASSLGTIIPHIKNKEVIISKLVSLLDDKQNWVRRSAMNMLSKIEGVTASQIPFEKVVNNLENEDPKLREASAGLLKIYGYSNIDRIFEKMLTLLEDENENVRKSMINGMVDVIQNIGIEKVFSDLVKNLSDEGSMDAQRSIALILRRTVKYADEKIKKRAISLLKIRCEMSQDPVICETLAFLREN
ncbi:MAG: sister chromatid cohesion protein PDS5 [Promethearchaeota archaeon]